MIFNLLQMKYVSSKKIPYFILIQQKHLIRDSMWNNKIYL
jgi:hypothetical protein